jgi:uncharacterized protein YjdB
MNKYTPMKNKILMVALILIMGIGSINAQTVITGFSENFNGAWTKVDSAFWAPNGGYIDNIDPQDTLIFTVNRMDDGTGNLALHIALLQKNFFDGQMYLLKDVKDHVLDATLNPVASFRVRIDSATWLIPDWGQGGILVPAADVPFQISFFVGDNRLSSYSYRVPIDGGWHEYVFNLNADADLTAIEKILIESVDWPNANKAYYWFDDFRLGDSVTTFVPLTSVDITGVAPVTVNNQQLQLGIAYSPAEASFKEVNWSVIPVTGYAKIDADGKLTPVADGDVKVVAVAKDISEVSDTATVTLTNQYDTITTYSQGFGDAATVDMFLWAPNKGYIDAVEPYDTLMFTVTVENNALHILERQKSFSDGQMYNFKTGIGKILDLTDKPLASIKIKIDSAQWIVNSTPSATVPFQLGPWTGDVRLGAYSIDVPIDGKYHTVYYNFFDPAVDLGGVEKMLLESVSWPAANKAYFWMDDFKIGAAVTVPYPVKSIIVTGANGADSISVKGKTLQMHATVSPDTATFTKVYWTVDDATVASIDQEGKLKPLKNGTVTVTAQAIDMSGVTGTLEVEITGQTPASGIADLKKTPYSIFPNPVTDVLRITNSQDLKKIQIVNLMGQVINPGIERNLQEVNVSFLREGAYILRITDARGRTYDLLFLKK